jgi:hypothetical protein
MTDIGMSGYASKDNMIADLRAEIERLRARIEAARSILEDDNGRGGHSEGRCLGKCLKPQLVEALFENGNDKPA